MNRREGRALDDFIDGFLRLLVIMAIGAIVYDVLTHPKGTRVLVAGFNDILKTGFAAELGKVR